MVKSYLRPVFKHMTNKKILETVYIQLLECKNQNQDYQTTVLKTTDFIHKELKKQEDWENQQFSQSWYDRETIN